MREPYCLRPWEIRRLTLRQIFEIYFKPRDTKTGEVSREAVADDDAGSSPFDSMGLDNHDAWKPVEGEDDSNPWSVPREIVKERSHAMILELTRRGQLAEYGVGKDDWQNAHFFFERVWRENTEVYERITRAMLSRDEAAVKEMAVAGALANYGVPKGDAAGAVAFYERMQAVNSERFERMRGENHNGG